MKKPSVGQWGTSVRVEKVGEMTRLGNYLLHNIKS
jgi:hypothetical protein